MIVLQKNTTASPKVCAECGLIIPQYNRMYSHSEDVHSLDPNTVANRPVYCSHDHIIRHTICGEKL